MILSILLTVATPYNGMGLFGEASSPIFAESCQYPRTASNVIWGSLKCVLKCVALESHDMRLRTQTPTNSIIWILVGLLWINTELFEMCGCWISWYVAHDKKRPTNSIKYHMGPHELCQISYGAFLKCVAVESHEMSLMRKSAPRTLSSDLLLLGHAGSADTAAHCNILQHTATRCTTLHKTATHGSTRNMLHPRSAALHTVIVQFTNSIIWIFE